MKKFTSILLAFALMFSLTACGNNDNAKNGETDNKENQNTETNTETENKDTENKDTEAAEENQDADNSESSEEELKVVDGMGREVIIPKNPEKVLALNSAMMESFFILGITPVGKVENYKIREEGMALPSVGTPNQIDLEKVYELKPDFIVAHTRFHSNMVDDLERSGAVVYYVNPEQVVKENNDDWRVVLAKALGKEDVWNEYLENLDKKGKEKGDEFRKIADIKTAVMLSVGEEVRAAQKACGFGIIMDKLGLENIVPEDLPDAGKKSWVKYDVEKIVEADPDVVLLLANSKDKEENKASLKAFKKDPKWASLKAVKENKVFMLPFSVNPNRSSFEGMIEKTADAIIKGLNKKGDKEGKKE